MRRRAFLAGLAILLAASGARAQSPSRVVRIGVLSFGSAPAPGAPEEPIVRHLRSLGYLNASNAIFDRRYAGGARERYPELAAELLRSKVDVIFAPGSDVARAFRDAAPTVPVVFVVSDDPVAAGLVQSFARPGGLFTGISLMSPELGGKRLEYLKVALPALRRVAVLYDKEHEFYLAQMRSPAERLEVTLLPIEFSGVPDFPGAFAAATRERAQAMFVAPNRFTLFYASRLAELSIQHRIPAISAYDVFANAGGLLSYGPIQDDAVARAAALIDRILKGAKPAELPVEQPPRVGLVVNKRTAKALGIEIPPGLLLQADRVIE
jgi:putative tryptophan/tyrosine transport system substrate-binding protein